MKNILLVYGGDSVESDISVLTGLQMYHYLDKTKYKIIPCYVRHGILHTFRVGKFLKPEFYAEFNKYKYTLSLCNKGYRTTIGSLMTKYRKIDCALLCTHGGACENGGLQGMLELYNIPYTSCGIYASSLCMDKWLAYRTLLRMNIKMPRTIQVSKEKNYDYQDIYNQLGGNIVVKPNSLGSSIGVSSPLNVEELQAGIDSALMFDTKALIQEKVCNLIELNCAAFLSSNGVVVSEIERPITAHDVLNFDDKYLNNGKMNGASREFPANIDNKLATRIKSITFKVFSALNMKGVARIDYLYDSVAKQLYLNEINTIPGSLAYYLFEKSGYCAELLLDELIDVAISMSGLAEKTIRSFKSSILVRSPKSGIKKLGIKNS